MTASRGALALVPEWSDWSPRPEHERESRRRRYAHRETLWRLSSLERVRKCGRVARAEVVPVVVGDGVAHFANLTRCASVHACPVCSPVVRQARADEIADGVGRWIAAGGAAYFVTLTMPHDRGDRLDALYRAIAKGQQSLWSGKAAKADRARFGIVGQIRALETTVGAAGWHPHVHSLVLLERPLSETDAADLARRLSHRWCTGITAAGFRSPDDAHGFTMKAVTDAQGIATYTAKLDGDVTTIGAGLELARWDLKTGRLANRSPWQVLADLHSWGDVADLALWNEYEKASKGRKALLWSRGLRERLRVVAVTDEEIVQAERLGEVVAVLDRHQWRSVTRTRSGAALVLDMAELSGAAGVAEALRVLARGSP